MLQAGSWPTRRFRSPRRRALMSMFLETLDALRRVPRKWLVTGVAGFIGSSLMEELLACDQEVVGLDNFSTGKRENLDEVVNRLSATQQKRFHFIEGDIRSTDACGRACSGVDFVVHQAALGSVPRSIADPIA